MGTILSVGGNGLITGSLQKPLGFCTLDWSNPLTVGMQDCLVFSEGVGAPINLAWPQIVTASANPAWVNTQAGIAGYATGGSAFTIGAHGSIGVGDCSVHIIFLPVSWPGADTALIDKGTGASARDMSIFVGVTGNIAFLSLGAGTGSSTAFSTGFTAGSVWDFTLTRSGTTVTAYVNGLSVGTQTRTGGTSSNGNLALGTNITGGGQNGDIQYIAMQTWTRALSATDVLSVYQDPYGFVIPAEPEMDAMFTSFSPTTAATVAYPVRGFYYTPDPVAVLY